MRISRFITYLVLACLPAWCAAGPSFAMPREGAAAPAGDVFAGDMVRSHGNASGGDPMDNLVVPDNVLRVDMVVYSGQTLKAYVKDILEQRPTTEQELYKYARDMALDIAGSDLALKASPGLADDIRVAAAVAKLKARVLPAIYFDEEVRKKVNPTVKDLMAKTPDPAPMYEVSVIVNPEESKIDEAAKALSAGEPFDAVARKLSEGMTAEKGGKLGALVEGKFDLFTEGEFRLIRTLKNGEVSRPFMSRIGWTILRMEKFWSAEALKRQDIEGDYPRYKAAEQNARFQELFEAIRIRFPVEWNEANLAKIKAALDNNLPLTDELMASEIFRVNGQPVLAFDMGSLSPFHSMSALDTYLDKRARTELLAQEAVRLGYAERVDVLVDIARRRTVTRQYFKRKSQTIKPTGKDLEAYYEKNKEMFKSEEERRLLVIETADKKKAGEAYQKAKKGGDFGKLAEIYCDKEEQRKGKGEAGFVSRKGMDPSAGEKIFSAREGAVLPPIAMTGKDGKAVYAVVKVASVRKPVVRPFVQVNRETLTDKIVSARMGDFYKEFIEAVNRSHRVDILLVQGGGEK